MTYQSPSWIAFYSYSRNCYDPSRYEHTLQKMPHPSHRRQPRWRQFLRLQQLLYAPQHIGRWKLRPYHSARHMSIWHPGPRSWRHCWKVEDKEETSGMRRMRWVAEIQMGKVKWLRRELQIAHKRSRTEDGVLGIVWWNQEYWGTGFGVKRLGIKKEEPSTAVLVKVKYPPTPQLTYPPSRTSTSQFRSVDPNEFLWSPVYRPSPF